VLGIERSNAGIPFFMAAAVDHFNFITFDFTELSRFHCEKASPALHRSVMKKNANYAMAMKLDLFSRSFYLATRSGLSVVSALGLQLARGDRRIKSRFSLSPFGCAALAPGSKRWSDLDRVDRGSLPCLPWSPTLANAFHTPESL
jgi:hypothetical protein